ncbi:sugar fermentation stimulation protein [Thermotoga sp. Mc24]|uniref:DNA/RNA nuclease SfsA n=1 Tax=Thermotoga sp. Mc24 TaxID=1231241 RepID=UPI0005440952|nr:DNA/RNA nuclease SfsA [Thermotoga sp. Mc24]KHC90420.1 sugar fermentation stimulation protein [Thermotoga sp. Mc24]
MRLKLPFDAEGIFLERKSKFTGVALVEEKETPIHIHNTGRLPLLEKGKRVLLKRAESGRRKTNWDLLAVEHRGEFVFVHSGYHSIVARKILEELFTGSMIENEKRFGNSRFDFLIDEKIFVEVKGCTYEEDGVAMFPDAPTGRGRRHIGELIKSVESGFKALLLILVFLESNCFLPNRNVDPAFSEIFWHALNSGVEIGVFRVKYDGEYLYSTEKLSICEEV